ncbi:uncharacterized protein F5891DRAFT_1058061 [Suillus fuscotomentosus]|uniref:Uncharacterized protein n=1 Tax=Suillus fuscotomentosus TaxID=1912939 RepID=A0AAD4DZM5_9AGAM|nr:uncharacterized protein F5891DRAFT_1058061 [Suillus fuscotomentosus]KAG1895563.1 hypothetical protein F5891DRAFT_1058061 [Suillus fuscotomentosus]
MSYASVAAHDAPPSSEQPRPDPALLTTERSSASNVIDDTLKVNVVSSDFKENPATYTSKTYVPEGIDDDLVDPGRKAVTGKGHKRLQEAQAEGIYLWEVTKHYLFRPGVAGGLIGLVNVGLLSRVGYGFYTKPSLRQNFTAISSAAAGALLLIGTEGYAAQKYRQTPIGRQEERRAREEGTLIYKQLREHVFRPGVLGGLVGLVNTAILGAVGYYSYVNWHKPKWNRDVVTAVAFGLLTLWGGEGYLAERYRAERRRQ